MEIIITVTLNPAVDTSTSVEHVASEQKLRCRQPQHEPGGGGLNVSRVLKRLGGDTLALYTSGGQTGKLLETLLELEGIWHQPIPVEKMTRENFIVFEDASGQQYRFGMPGPQLQESEWQRCLETLETMDSKASYIVGSGSLPPGAPSDFYARMAEIAARKGARAIVDTSQEALKHALKNGVYLIKPNMRELQELVGANIENEQQQEEMAQQLVASGKCDVVVLSLGSAGVLLASADGAERLRSPSVPIRSKVGAGDSMLAGIVFKLAQGASLHDAVTFGIAAGAAAVMTPGTELCRPKDVERLYQTLVQKEEGR